MRGIYRDVVTGPDGRPLSDSGWASNTITRSVWPLLAGLLCGQEGWQGVRFWAVGEGDPAWDSSPHRASPEVEGLRSEFDRLPVTRGDITFLDAEDRPSERPTPRLEIRLTFRWPDRARSLREFALVGGEADDRAGSGQLVNYVVHRRVDLPAGAALERTLRLTLDDLATGGTSIRTGHWLGGEPVDIVDGVGSATGLALRGVAIETVADLARADPADLGIGLPLMKRVEATTRARLALSTAASFTAAGTAVGSLRVVEALAMSPAGLARQSGISEAEAGRWLERLSLLQLALDQSFLAPLTVGDLARSP